MIVRLQSPAKALSICVACVLATVGPSHAFENAPPKSLWPTLLDACLSSLQTGKFSEKHKAVFLDHGYEDRQPRATLTWFRKEHSKARGGPQWRNWAYYHHEKKTRARKCDFKDTYLDTPEFFRAYEAAMKRNGFTDVTRSRSSSRVYQRGKLFVQNKFLAERLKEEIIREVEIRARLTPD